MTTKTLELGSVRRSGGFAWMLVAIDGDRLTVQDVRYGITRQWTVADWAPPSVDMNPVDDVADDDE